MFGALSLARTLRANPHDEIGQMQIRSVTAAIQQSPPSQEILEFPVDMLPAEGVAFLFRYCFREGSGLAASGIV
jgi:hypothetical protein